jgi:adenylate kinase
MDRGELVPDAVTIEMLLERLAKPDAAAGILLDGFPRNTAQAEVLDKALADKGGRVDVAPYIEVPERISWLASAAAGSAAPGPSLPRADQAAAQARDLRRRRVGALPAHDDQPATVQARLRQQLGALDQVVGYYRGHGVLKAVDGRGPSTVTADLLAAIGPPAAVGRGLGRVDARSPQDTSGDRPDAPCRPHRRRRARPDGGGAQAGASPRPNSTPSPRTTSARPEPGRPSRATGAFRRASASRSTTRSSTGSRAAGSSRTARSSPSMPARSGRATTATPPGRSTSALRRPTWPGSSKRRAWP